MSDALQSSTNSRRCHACGTKVRADARFCGNCGIKLSQPYDIDAPSLLGTTVAGAYKIEGVLGTGSMGVVYRAEQLALRRQVALKVIGESADDDVTRARFRREARAASQLNHPNVVQVYDFGQLPGGQPYLAMELLKGLTLEQLIEREFPLELERIIRIQIDILTALQAAHDLGILHRDLKPANVFISELPNGDELAKVLDFGIATAMDSSLTGTQTWAPLTEAGFVCGTPAFMSPEQVQGFPLDQRSDLFSAAGLLYQMMTRERPFKGKSPVEVGANIVLKPLVPPSRALPDLRPTDRLDDFLLKAMAKQPDDRYANANEMIDDLRGLLTSLKNDTMPDLPSAETAVPPTADWPESADDEALHYPDTVVNHEAVTTGDIDAPGHRAGAVAPAKASRAPKGRLPTPFAELDLGDLAAGAPATTTESAKAAARGQGAAKPPRIRGTGSAGRPRSRRAAGAAPDDSRTSKARSRSATRARGAGEAAERSAGSVARASGSRPSGREDATTADELSQLRRAHRGWLPWLLFVTLAVGVLVWLIFFSPWAAEFG